MSWPAIDAARRCDEAARVPLLVNGAAAGSVARMHLPALGHLGLRGVGDTVRLDGGADALTRRLAAANAALRDQGLIKAWRDEPFALFDPASLARLATMERAACRFWGTLTLGAHANGFVADGAGRPTHLWIAQRSLTKPTDPGKLDNLIGGGVPDGQTPLDALLREGWEEAGLRSEAMHGVTPGSVLGLKRDIPEGLQQEWLYAYDLRLDPQLKPQNQDGEVAAFRCLPVDEALALAAGDAMTVDAALITLDFALRHRLLARVECTTLEQRLRPLRIRPPLQPQ